MAIKTTYGNTTVCVTKILLKNKVYKYVVKPFYKKSGKTYYGKLSYSVTAMTARSAKNNVTSLKFTAYKRTMTSKTVKTFNVKAGGSMLFSKAIRWYSTNSSVASISTKGVVTARKAGITYIKATSHNGKRCTVKLTVTSTKKVINGIIFDTKDFPSSIHISTGSGKTQLLYVEGNINPNDLKYVINKGNNQVFEKYRTSLNQPATTTEKKIAGYSAVVPNWTNRIAYVEAGYDDGYAYKYRVSIHPLINKGSFPLEIYYKNILLTRCTIFVDSTSATEVKNNNLVKGMESKLWTANMTNEEKLSRISTYISQNYTYEQMICCSGAMCIYYAARDLGLACYYTYTDGEPNLTSTTPFYPNEIGGHVNCTVEVSPGVHKTYNVQGGKK